MPRTKMSANGITYNAAISACEISDQWQFAPNLLILIPRLTVVADGITYSAAINACEEG